MVSRLTRHSTGLSPGGTSVCSSRAPARPSVPRVQHNARLLRVWLCVSEALVRRAGRHTSSAGRPNIHFDGNGMTHITFAADLTTGDEGCPALTTCTRTPCPVPSKEEWQLRVRQLQVCQPRGHQYHHPRHVHVAQLAVPKVARPRRNFEHPASRRRNALSQPAFDALERLRTSLHRVLTHTGNLKRTAAPFYVTVGDQVIIANCGMELQSRRLRTKTAGRP